jgi:copper chaperone CopZ
MQSEYLSVTGMHSNSCASAVRQALTALPGVGQVEVSLPDGAVTIHFNERLMSPDRLLSAVEEAGYGVDQAGTIRRPRACAAVSQSDAP